MSPRHGIRPLPEGGVRLTISEQERAALRALPDQLQAILDGDVQSAEALGVRDRLLPRAYEDDELEREYRALVGARLLEERSELLATFARTLDAGDTAGNDWTAVLTPDEAHAWLVVLNDSRLALATIVGITTEQDWSEGPDPNDPASVLLWYLGSLEEQFVGALESNLPGSP